MDSDGSNSRVTAGVAQADGEPAQIRVGPGWAVIGIFLLLAVAALGYARGFLMPTVLGLLLALVFSPPRRTLERLGLGSGAAAFVITSTLLAVLVAGVLALAAPVADWANEARTIGSQVEFKLRELRGIAADVQEAAKQVEEIANSARETDVQRVEVAGPGIASSLAGALPAAVAQALFTLVLMFFLLASGDMLYEKIVEVSPTFRDKRRAVSIARDIERKLSQYLFTITAINAGLGVAVGLAMWLLGMPNPLLFGVIAFLLNYIPYVGALAGVALAAVVGLVSLPTAWDALLAAGVYLALTSIEGQFVTPVFVGRNLQLNTVVVFLSVTFWAWLWSVVGMLVATPMLVTIRVFCAHVPALQGVGVFLSGRGAARDGDDAGPARRASAERPPDG